MLTRLTVKALAVLVAAIGCVAFLGVGAAQATEEEVGTGESVIGTLLTNDRQPVAGASITVSDASGFSQVAITETDGTWAVPVPKTGKYTVTLDVATLPTGINEPVKNPIETTVRPGTDRTVLFVLGERPRDTETTLDRAAQLTVEGLQFGLILALAAVGLSLIYGTTGLTNFAHGEIVTFGAIIVWWFNISLGLGLIVAGILGVIVVGALRRRPGRGTMETLAQARNRARSP